MALLELEKRRAVDGSNVLCCKRSSEVLLWLWQVRGGPSVCKVRRPLGHDNYIAGGVGREPHTSVTCPTTLSALN